MRSLRALVLSLLAAWILCLQCATGFSILFLARRGRKGGLQRALDDTDHTKKPTSSRSFNRGRGQEITGVSLPADGRIKGWEFGQGVRMVCANVGGKFYALQVRFGRACVESCFVMVSTQLRSPLIFMHLKVPLSRHYPKGECPRCAFDLWKGDLIVDDPGFEQDSIACPTCATTYALASGKAGDPLKRNGFSAFVGNLAKTATAKEANRNAKAFDISRDEETGQVFCREK